MGEGWGEGVGGRGGEGREGEEMEEDERESWCKERERDTDPADKGREEEEEEGEGDSFSSPSPSPSPSLPLSLSPILEYPASFFDSDGSRLPRRTNTRSDRFTSPSRAIMVRKKIVLTSSKRSVST